MTETTTVTENTWDYPLKFKLTVKGTTWEKLDFRRPKAKDLRLMSNSKAPEGDKLMTMLASLSQNGLGPKELDEIDAEDFMELNEKLTGFLGKKSPV